MLAELTFQAPLTHMEVKRRFDQHLPCTTVDPQRLLQAFTTITLHACQTVMGYQQGARLIVETARSQSAIHLAFRAEIHDLTNGPGTGLLESFLTTKEGTSGLALSLAYGIIKEHDGRMSVHNTPGEGITYIVELPIRTLLPSPMEAPTDAIDVVGRKRVLVVDADEKNLALLQEIVRHLGHDSFGRASAQQALQAVEDNDYDLIITDMHLPELDGIHLYQRLSTLRPELAKQVIFISGEVVNDEVSVFLERLGCHLVRKPFSVADIEVGMRQALGG
jgi:CheY-like chemotaxis protein